MVQFFLELSDIERVVYTLLLFTFLYQVMVWLSFSVIATHRHRPAAENVSDTPPAISVVIVVGDGGSWYVESEIEKILSQRYDGEWEVVVVNDCGGVEVSSALSDLQLSSPRLRFTELRKDPKFPHSRKMPLFLGIKAAKFPNIVIADPTASPRSDKWLSIISKGFVGGECVIGYSGFTPDTNKFIRSSRLMSSIRSLTSAVNYRPYKGIFNNIGYSRELFFQLRGYTHLRLATGEDDLFIQKLSEYRDISVILNPKATMEQTAFGGLSWWWNEQRYRTFSRKYYPRSVRFKTFMELFMKFLFFCSVGYIIIDSTLFGGLWWGWIAALSALVVRELVAIWSLRRIMRRLGEKKLLGTFLIYDLLNPITEFFLAISRRVKAPGEIWK